MGKEELAISVIVESCHSVEGYKKFKRLLMYQRESWSWRLSTGNIKRVGCLVQDTSYIYILHILHLSVWED